VADATPIGPGARRLIALGQAVAIPAPKLKCSNVNASNPGNPTQRPLSLEDEILNARPMRVVNPGQRSNDQVSLERHAATLQARMGPTRIVAGPDPETPKDGAIFSYDTRTRALSEADLLARVKHVLRKGERWLQFVARTGLGPHQVRTMTRDEIKRFVDIGSKNEQTVKEPKQRNVREVEDSASTPAPAPAPRLVPVGW